MNKFNLLIAALVLINASLFGQSVTISPSGSENLEIFKVGNALLSMKGKSQGITEGTSIINLESNHGAVAGFSGTATKGISAINFNSPTENKFSIKHEHYYTTSLTSGVKNYSSLLLNNGLEEIARFENDFFSVKKIGINDQDPYYPLTFNNTFGDKISLNNRTCNFILGNCFSTYEHYGIGLQNNLFQIFTKDALGDIVFGYGKSSSMTERFRIKGNGNIGIGLPNPNNILDINGRARIRHNGNTAGVWFSNSSNGLNDADGAFLGLKTDSEAGIWIGNAWRFWVNSTGDLNTTGEVNRTQTSTANIVPIAYGNISEQGTKNVNSTTDNVSVVRLGTGFYEITITGETYNMVNYTTIASLNNENVFGFISSGSTAGKLTVYTANSSGVASDRFFTFVVYKK